MPLTGRSEHCNGKLKLMVDEYMMYTTGQTGPLPPVAQAPEAPVDVVLDFNEAYDANQIMPVDNDDGGNDDGGFELAGPSSSMPPYVIRYAFHCYVTDLRQRQLQSLVH